MGIGVSQQDLAQGHAMPWIARCRLAVAQGDGVFRGDARITEGYWLRHPVGEAEMLSADTNFVELKVERELVDDFHAVRRERLADLLAPDLNVGDSRAVEQQQRMHGRPGRRLRGAFAPFVVAAVRNIAAPQGAIVYDGLLPPVLHLVAEAAEPVVLVHPLAKRRGKCRQRLRRESRLLQADPGKGDSGGTRLDPSIAGGDGRHLHQCLQPETPADIGLRSVAVEEQRLARR